MLIKNIENNLGIFLCGFLGCLEMLHCKELRFFALRPVHQDASFKPSKLNIKRFFLLFRGGGVI